MFDVSDLLAIQKLVHAYPRFLDSGDLAGLGGLFAHASVHFESLDAPVVRDSGAVTQMFSNFVQIYDGVPRTRHMICNLVIEPVSAVRATATSAVFVLQATPALPLQPIITGDYADAFDKVDGAWRFAERRITNDLFGDLSAHGKYPIGDV
jgi:hypothetical protein